MNHIVKLEGCPNFRDLGGYNCVDGRVTKTDKFYRADCLAKLTENDINILKGMRITYVVDLRSDSEIEREPNPLKDREGFVYYNFPLIDGMQSSNFEGLVPPSLLELYVGLADNAQGTIREIMEVFLQEGKVVFHCSAGKDRTGVIAALLLILANTNEDEIVEDYSATYPLMKDIFEAQMTGAAQFGIDIPRDIMLSEPETMVSFLEHMKKTYKNGVAYFRQLGMKDDEIIKLCELIGGNPA